MFLFELDDPQINKLVAISDQLKDEIESGQIAGEYNVDQLLNYFKNYDIILDVKDLYSMIKKPPLNKVVANIQGDKVVWKGSESVPGEVTDKNEKVVQQMAKNALK